MFKEYKDVNLKKIKDFNNRDYLYHLLPWACNYENKDFYISKEIAGKTQTFHFPIVITKDGSFQTTFKVRGKDLDSSTAYELLSVTERMNETLKQLDNSWTLQMNAIRSKIRNYVGKKGIKNIPIRILELERSEFFNSGNHYESDYYITFTWLVPEDNLQKAKSLLFRENDKKLINDTFQKNLKYYNNELLKIYSFLNETLQECEVLNVDETMAYYHSFVSDNSHKIKVPRAIYYEGKLIATGDMPELIKKAIEKGELNENGIKETLLPVFIDSYITDSTLTGGINPQIGEDYIKTISILNFPGFSVPGMIDRLNRTDIEYIWGSRYIMLEKITIKKILDKYYNKWWAARLSFKDMFIEFFSKNETTNPNQSAMNAAIEVRDEKTKLDEDRDIVGYYTTTVILKNKNRDVVERQAQEVRTLLSSLGFVVQIEDFYTLDCWLGVMPGNNYFNERRPFMNSKVLSHMLPINSVWAGNKWNKHLDTPPLLYCQTTGNTPFRLNLHYTDVGHTLIVGPTGSGKSVLLGTIQGAFLGYKNAKVIGFDKGASTKVLNRAYGGLFYDLGKDNIRFQPLRGVGTIQTKIDIEFEKIKKNNRNLSDETIRKKAEEIEKKRSDIEKEWCQEFIENLLEDNHVQITPEIRQFIWNGLVSLGSLSPEMRTLSSFSNLVGGQSKTIKDALAQYCGKGPYAKYFDGNSDFLENNNYTIFEMEQIAEAKNAITPALNYLFHKIETDMIDKISPTLITLDESWLFLDNPRFESKIREWLKVMRKNNVSVVFATQSLADIAESKIKSAILDACYTRIYLPNTTALSEVQKNYYKMFDLNDREIEIIYQSLQKKHYYFKNPQGSRLFELALSPLELSYVAASSGEDKEKCDELENLNTKEFNIAWLNYKGWNGEAIVERIEKMIADEKKVN